MLKLLPRSVALLSCMVFFGAPAATSQMLSVQQVATGLTAPLYVCSPPGDMDRLFIVEQGGRIKILKSSGVLATPFLNISTAILSGGERGLLGMAFHPDYASNGKFYVCFTDPAGSSRIRQYFVSASPDVATLAGAVDIYGPISQPFSNHNGGCLQFGPDGKLYLGLGDGGSGGDPGDRAQSTTTSLGKMLRFDVDIPAPHIPADNPYVGVGGILPEIWARGLRNPWRFSFDRLTGDLWIADVGQNAWEEINFTPASSTGGENYGWRCREGTACYTSSTGCTCAGPGLLDPIQVYNHAGGKCSVTGGYVYRGNAICGLQGTYFYADYCSDQIWSLRYNGAVVSEFQDRTAELAIPGAEEITSFGEDAAGEMYIVDANGGQIWKLTGTGSAGVCGDCSNPRDGFVTILDAFEAARIAVLIATASGTQTCLCDTNLDGAINVLDSLMMAQTSVGMPIVLTCP